MTQSAEHPRARGENLLDELIPLVRGGTSPRTRGKPVSCAIITQCRGNIPAHAGKTRGCLVVIGKALEHPRARGENPAPPAPTNTYLGTSPRTRGKLGGATMEYRSDRNIPAHAGKTSPFFKTSPRAVGTSPRTRGKPEKIGCPTSSIRNIPAYAGKTARRRNAL